MCFLVTKQRLAWLLCCAKPRLEKSKNPGQHSIFVGRGCQDADQCNLKTEQPCQKDIIGSSVLTYSVVVSVERQYSCHTSEQREEKE
jgi:hypothetical protein